MTGIKWAVVSLLALGVAACGGGDKTPPKSGDGGGGGSTAWKSAVGDQGLFAQTFGGEVWQKKAVSDQDLYAVTCVGNADGWAVGAAGTAVRTRDGGKTWTAEDAQTTVTLRTVRFALDSRTATTRMVGVTAGDAGTIRLSLDGGDHWAPASTSSTATLRSATAAVSADLFVVVGDAGTVLRSTDLGASWQLQSLADAGNLTGVALEPNGALIVAADDQGHLFASHDLGATFSLEATQTATWNAIAIASDGSHALAAGAGGKLARRDAAGTWSELSSGTDDDLFATLIDSDGDTIAGAHGALRYRGPADGDTWTTLPLGTQVTLRGLEDFGVD
jgi:photosystem II stability/assembly factor-like uncharacterized protein